MRRFSSLAREFFNPIASRSEVGKLGTANYRMFFHNKEGRTLSPWHDVPFPSLDKQKVILPLICEIPKGMTAKMEVCLTERFNPIAQDVTKDKKPRFLPIIPKFNYGMVPQTYETPKKKCEISGLLGDGDPIDVVDISPNQLNLGDIVPVRLLGSFCFVDSGEADWKLIVTSDESTEINKAILDLMFGFFENYKGEESGNYIFGDRKVFTPEETIEILKYVHLSYKDLINSARLTQNGAESDEDEPKGIWMPRTERL